MALRCFDRRRDQLLEGLSAGQREMAKTTSFPCLKHWRKTGRKKFDSFSLLFRAFCNMVLRKNTINFAGAS